MGLPIFLFLKKNFDIIVLERKEKDVAAAGERSET